MEYPDSSSGSSAGWIVDGNFKVAYSEERIRKPVIDNINWKFVASVAIIAMAVSLLSGGLGGISFGVLITRALIGGVIFSVLGAGLNLLVFRFFPEILEIVISDTGETGAGGDNESESEAPGSRVNIVLPSESIESSDSDGASEDGRTSDGDAGELKAAEPEEEDSIENLDRFSESFSDDDMEETGGASSKNSSGGEHDPEEIAQAIHTVIKRDEKG